MRPSGRWREPPRRHRITSAAPSGSRCAAPECREPLESLARLLEIEALHVAEIQRHRQAIEAEFSRRRFERFLDSLTLAHDAEVVEEPAQRQRPPYPIGADQAKSRLLGKRLQRRRREEVDMTFARETAFAPAEQLVHEGVITG